MVIKEIKQFIINQMKEADWTMEKYIDSERFKSKYIVIKITNDSVDFKIDMNHYGDSFDLTIKELEFNYIHFLWQLRYVKKSCELYNKRKREREISDEWNKFLERNKDLKRENKINQILD